VIPELREGRWYIPGKWHEGDLVLNECGLGHELGPAPSAEMVAKVTAWILENTVDAPKDPGCRARSSYGWKHLCEHQVGEWIANGAFIEAGFRLGLPVRWVDGPNVGFTSRLLCGHCRKSIPPRRAFIFRTVSTDAPRPLCRKCARALFPNCPS
jgi:hypothetical protein